ncbi:MAG: hypothetical protein IT326_00775, partial [Anaerolineae bacterium]|nr:hypothetical protein [Anaerolineae bacterium]
MKRATGWLSILILLVVTAGLAAVFFDRALDRSYIIYRYAWNIAAGYGATYNAGENLLNAAAAPLYAAFLAGVQSALSSLLPLQSFISAGVVNTLSFPLISNAIGVISLAGGAICLYGLLRDDENPLAGGLAGAAYLIFPLLWFTLGLETALWLALCLFAVWLYVTDHEANAALALGLATLVRPEGLLLALVLIAHGAFTRRSYWVFPLIVYSACILPGALWLLAQHGSLPGIGQAGAPAEAAGFGAVAASVGSLSLLWGVLLLVGLTGFARLRSHSAGLILTAWALLHLVIFAILRLPFYAWNIAPAVPALAALVVLGVQWIVAHFDEPLTRQIGWGVAGLLLAGSAGELVFTVMTTSPTAGTPWQTNMPQLARAEYLQAGLWIEANTPAGARIGAGQSGALGYTARRPLVDYTGVLAPALAPAYARHDGRWWLHEAPPDYLVLTTAEYASLNGYEAAADPWFNAVFNEVARIDPAGPGGETVIIFRRVQELIPLQDVLVGVEQYSNGLSVSSIATDFPLSPITFSGTGRIRLRWLLDRPIPAPLYVSIRIQGRGESGALAGMSGYTIDFPRWPTNQFITTYHTIDVFPNLPPGVYDIEVGIG